jgi:hypothetical protein
MKGVKVHQQFCIINPTSLHKREERISMQNHWSSSWSTPASGAFLAQQPKATQRLLRCRCCRQPPERGCDYHYYHFHPRRHIIGGGGSGRDYIRSSRNIGAGSLLLAHLLFFFIGVAENDDLVIVGRPKDVTVEVAKKSSGKLLIPWDISDEIFLICTQVIWSFDERG